MLRNLAVFAVILTCLLLVVPAGPASATQTTAKEALKANFLQFLPSYIEHIKKKDGKFLSAVHPELPESMYDFFFTATQNMMRYAEKNHLQPTVTCKDYGVCKVTWPQPNDSWAAQSFIRHEGTWRWLSE